jgi:hypothetical protein
MEAAWIQASDHDIAWIEVCYYGDLIEIEVGDDTVVVDQNLPAIMVTRIEAAAEMGARIELDSFAA